MTTLKYTRDIDNLFFIKLDETAEELGADPQRMLAVMYSESGCSATAHNDNPKNVPPEKRWNASGLIQFMPDTLTRMGWTQGHAAFRRLTATEQVPWVRRYYLPYKGYLASVGGLYVATFLPALIRHAGDPAFILTAKSGPLGWAYAPNAAFDANRDYAITVGELQDAVLRNARGPRWGELLARLEGKDIAANSEEDEIDLRTTLGLQRALIKLGYTPGEADGLPGPRTLGALASFQLAAGLIPDGIFGPLSRAAAELALQQIDAG